jgi:ABC-type sulfate transport system substrate-binding protein
MKLFDISSVAKNWDDACQRFFDDGGVFDKIYEK